MAKDPAFLFYTQDFIVGVQTMTHEDRGKYITILCQMHQQGRLKEETIRFLVGSVSDNLKAKFRIDENGFWFNERLELETRKRNNFTESRRENGNKGGRPKVEKPKGKPKQNHMDNHMGNVNEDVIEDDNSTIVYGEKSDVVFKIKREYLTDKNYIVYGVDGYKKMIEAEGLHIPQADISHLKKFLFEKNGVIFDGQPSFVINSFKKFIKGTYK